MLPARPGHHRHHPGAAARTGQVILLAEDQARLRRVIGAQLKGAGYTVLAPADAEAALALARDPSVAIDLVLTDMVMPGRAGQRLAALLRDVRPGLRVVFMSGFAHPLAASEPVDAPVLQKPFTDAELLRRVADELRGSAGPSRTG